MNFAIKTNKKDFDRTLSKYLDKNHKFAIAKTLNNLAFDIRSSERNKLSDYFSLRTRRMLTTMQVVKADKNNLVATLGVRDKIAAMNITGGIKLPQSGSLGIPTAEGRKILNPSRETLSAKRLQPRGLLKSPRKLANVKNKPFLTKTRGGTKAIAVRNGNSRDLMFLYFFKRKSVIPERWKLIDNSIKEVENNFDKLMSKNLKFAYRTAK
jgi:hypothetical protein